ncbi:MAG: hypothetical protein PHF51_02205 [Candidatus ainarchaeum sp.]|nr:hypothetical protein [Candidatus ainarchaeum sp.]
MSVKTRAVPGNDRTGQTGNPFARHGKAESAAIEPRIAGALQTGDFFGMTSVMNIISFGPAEVSKDALKLAARENRWQLVRLMTYHPPDGANDFRDLARKLFAGIKDDEARFQAMVDGPVYDCDAIRAIAECCPESRVFRAARRECNTPLMKSAWENQRLLPKLAKGMPGVELTELHWSAVSENGRKVLSCQGLYRIKGESWEQDEASDAIKRLEESLPKAVKNSNPGPEICVVGWQGNGALVYCKWDTKVAGNAEA